MRKTNLLTKLRFKPQVSAAFASVSILIHAIFVDPEVLLLKLFCDGDGIFDNTRKFYWQSGCGIILLTYVVFACWCAPYVVKSKVRAILGAQVTFLLPQSITVRLLGGKDFLPQP
jgi:hypothetical protein